MTTNRRSNPLAALVALAVLFSPALYVLSVGPAVWLGDHGYHNGQATEIIYAPLNYFANHVPFFGDALLWYVELWR